MINWLRKKALERRLSKEEANIGNVLVELGLVTREQLVEGVKVKVESGGPREQKLGEVLISLGYITHPQLERALKVQAALRGPPAVAAKVAEAIKKSREVFEDLDSVNSLREAAERLSKRIEDTESKERLDTKDR